MDDAFFLVPIPQDEPARGLWFDRGVAFGTELLSLPHEAQVEHVRRLARVDPLPTLSRFLLFARLFETHAPTLAARLCCFALLAAAEIPASPQRWRLLAGVSSRLGDSLRQAERFDEAEAAFAQASAILARIPTDLEARGLYLSLLAELCRDQGDLDAADRLLAHALALVEQTP
jgi:tetratricopeptide (TPR) repeat protein